MVILCIDPGTFLGWAIYVNGAIETGEESFKPQRGESTGMRWLHFRSWLVKILTAGYSAPDLVIFEQAVARASGAAREIMYGQATRIQEECERQGINYETINPNTLKMFATGKGNSGKDKMLAAARREAKKLQSCSKRTGFEEITSDNEGDALLILCWAMSKGYHEMEGDQ